MDNVLQLTNRHTGESLRLCRVRDGDDQTVLRIEGLLPPHAEGPPAHVHWHLREEGVVAGGTLAAKRGEESLLLRAGESIVFPPGVVHSWWNGGEDLLKVNGRAVPAGDLDRFLQGIFAVLNASPAGRPSLFHFAHVLWRHRHTHHVTRPPRVIQAILFPLVIGVGRMLGKYRGTSWPGAPEMCTGAPEEA